MMGIPISSYDSLRKAGNDLIVDIQKRYTISKDEAPALHEALNTEMLGVKGKENQLADGVYDFKSAFDGVYVYIFRVFFLQTPVGIKKLVKQMLKDDIDQLQPLFRPGQFERAGNIDRIIDDGMDEFYKNVKYRGTGFAYIEALMHIYNYIMGQI